MYKLFEELNIYYNLMKNYVPEIVNDTNRNIKIEFITGIFMEVHVTIQIVST